MYKEADLTRKENLEPNSQMVYDSKSKKRYAKGNFLGKGGFAKCYEVVDTDTNTVYACKIVSKNQLMKQHQKDKMASEIKIHKSMDNPNIVKFYSYFEDKNNVYIILELCNKRTLLELHKRRKCLTDPEVRYYLYQIVQACKYMHENCVIHRDLKLGNLFLDENLHIKVGDFGLAARIEFAGERKKTLCGTPNYIAPEILNKTGHSLEVDIWSLGCILYTLQAGDPPFETSNVKDTYNRIKKSDYVIPSRVPKAAQSLIVKLLQSDPCKRPNIFEVANDPYFTHGYMPASLPLSSLTVAPRFPNALQISHMAPSEKSYVDKPGSDENNFKPLIQVTEKSHALRVCDTEMTSFDDGEAGQMEEPKDCYLGAIFEMVSKCLAKNPHKLQRINEAEAEDPGSAPFYWITKWVDYSERYGLGYQLSDRSFGVLFNDQTRLISTEDRATIAYIDEDTKETYMTLEEYPPTLKKKITLLKYFHNYMKQNLLTAGSDIQAKKTEEMIRLPTLRMWRRDSTLIIFLLSCGILQANFFVDHCKLIVCPHLSSVTFIDQQRQSHTYKFSLIEKYGCSSHFYSLLKTLNESIKGLIQALEPGDPKK